MNFRRALVAAAAVAGLAALAPSGAFAQSCTGTTCDLGGKVKYQVGTSLPVPITFNPPRTGLLITAGVPGSAIPAIPGATIMQTLGPAPRQLTLAPGQMIYDESTVAIPLFFLGNGSIFDVKTNIDNSFPAASLANPNKPAGSAVFAAGGRSGAPVVSFCIDPSLNLTGGPVSASFNPGCLGPSTTSLGGAPTIHGLARYTATRNQFGGVAHDDNTAPGFRVTVGINAFGLTGGNLPCTGGPGCAFILSVMSTAPGTVDNGGSFLGSPVVSSAQVIPTAAFTGSIGPAGTILAVGSPVLTPGGAPIPWNVQANTNYGAPFTTGRLSQTVTAVNPGNPTIMFVRTGADGRNANGSGLVNMVAGGLNNRSVTGASATRGWLTLQIPEVGTLAGSAMALLAIGGFHGVSRRRRNRTE